MEDRAAAQRGDNETQTPSSLGPSLALCRSGVVVNWGDVPTWRAVAVGAVGGGIALRQLWQQGRVIKDEVNRNRRRDELIDRQLRELEQRTYTIE